MLQKASAFQTLVAISYELLFQAKAVCRQLGYHSVAKVYDDSNFGLVSEDFAYRVTLCLGHENVLGECLVRQGDPTPLCRASTGAGVRCSDEPEQTPAGKVSLQTAASSKLRAIFKKMPIPLKRPNYPCANY